MQGDGMGKGRGTPPPWPEVIFFVNLRGQGGSPFTFQPYDSSTATMQSSKDGSSFKLSVFFYGRPPHAGGRSLNLKSFNKGESHFAAWVLSVVRARCRCSAPA